MSGGHYDYVCWKIEEIQIEHTDTMPRRAAFQKLISLVGHAMYEVEWADSGDTTPGCDRENAAIDACLDMLGQDPEVVRKAAAYDSMSRVLKEFFKWEEIK